MRAFLEAETSSNNGPRPHTSPTDVEGNGTTKMQRVVSVVKGSKLWVSISKSLWHLALGGGGGPYDDWKQRTCFEKEIHLSS